MVWKAPGQLNLKSPEHPEGLGGMSQVPSNGPTGRSLRELLITPTRWPLSTTCPLGRGLTLRIQLQGTSRQVEDIWPRHHPPHTHIHTESTAAALGVLSGGKEHPGNRHPDPDIWWSPKKDDLPFSYPPPHPKHRACDQPFKGLSRVWQTAANMREQNYRKKKPKANRQSREHKKT